MTPPHWSSWREAMGRALYGEAGFYLTAGAPAGGFRTAAHASPLWAVALLELATRVNAALGSPADFAVVDMGAGGGELLAGMAAIAPDHWSLIGVDVAPRPAELPDRVRWQHDLPRGVSGLLMAVEYLDVVPVDVVELTETGCRLVEVSESGEERLGPEPPERDLAWLRQWWPLAEVGDRAEVGHTRDAAWRQLSATVTAGLAVAVDYAAVPARDVAGTLTAYRDGRQLAAVPDGSCDLTAHVLLASLVADGDVLLDQRHALQALGISATRPRYGDDPAGYLAALSQAGEAAELTDPNGLGGFRWLLHPVGIVSPLSTVSGPPAPAPARRH
jgi:SAM-dependent MidA family methyltransferase